VALGRSAVVGTARLAEDIARGQAVARYSLEGFSRGRWQPLARGTTIGYCKLDRFAPVEVDRLRVTVEDAVSTLETLRIAAYGSPVAR